MKYQDITHKILGCAMEVHSTLGNGFQEVIYQRALAIEFQKAELVFAREVEMPVIYKENEIGTRRVDFLIEEVVLVELKAVTEINDSHFAQIINYLEAFHLEVGLLLNFGEKSLFYKRFIHTVKNDS